MVHASHPYKAVGNTTVSRTLSFVFLHCPFQIEIIFVNRVVAIASLLLISGVLFPFALWIETEGNIPIKDLIGRNHLSI